MLTTKRGGCSKRAKRRRVDRARRASMPTTPTGSKARPTMPSGGSNLSFSLAGGNALSTSYYGTDMVAIQTQGLITNSFELDASLRQRARLHGGGGIEGTEVFHYDSAGDSPAWTELNGRWTRNITGIGGELAAVQNSATGITFRLTNLHGDVVAIADPSSTATNSLQPFGSTSSGTRCRKAPPVALGGWAASSAARSSHQG